MVSERLKFDFALIQRKWFGIFLVHQRNRLRNRLHPFCNHAKLTKERRQSPHDPPGHGVQAQGQRSGGSDGTNTGLPLHPKPKRPTDNCDDEQSVQGHQHDVHDGEQAHFLLERHARLFDGLFRVVELLRAVREHLHRMNVGVAVNNAPRHFGPRIRRGLRCGANAPHSPDDKTSVQEQPGDQRDRQPRIRLPQKDQRTNDVGEGEGNRVKDLEYGLTRRRGGLHDPVRNATRKVIFKPTHRLTQNMFVRPPSDQRAKIRQNRVVQKKHIQRLKRRTDQQDEDSQSNQPTAISLPHLRGFARQNVDNPAHGPDQPNLDRGDNDGHQRGIPKHLFERPRVLEHERHQLCRRHVLFIVRAVGIDEVFKKAEHRTGLLRLVRTEQRADA